MSNRIVALDTEDGDTIYVETTVNESTLELVADSGDHVIRAIGKFEQSLDPVINMAKSVITGIRGMQVEMPSDIELEFSVKLSGTMDFWVISGNGEGNINLKLRWSK